MQACLLGVLVYYFAGSILLTEYRAQWQTGQTAWVHFFNQNIVSLIFYTYISALRFSG